MATLVQGINIIVPVMNQNPAVQPPQPPNPSYQLVTTGGNMNPHQVELEPMVVNISNGNLTVPNAVLGAQGTYPIASVRWDITKLMQTIKSTVEISGTVTYVTTETPEEITTEQTINMTCQCYPLVVPLADPNMTLTNQTPIALLKMFIRAGNPNMAEIDNENDDAVSKQANVIELKKVLTQQHKVQSPVKDQPQSAGAVE